MEVYSGRPADAAQRLEKERRAYDLLDSLGIAYHRADHAPADTIEQCAAVDAALDVVICKNLFLCNRQETTFYLLMMPGDKPFKTKQLSAQLAGCQEQYRRLLESYKGSALQAASALQKAQENVARLPQVFDQISEGLHQLGEMAQKKD